MNKRLKVIMDKYDAIKESENLDKFDLDKDMEAVEESLEAKYDYRKILEEIENK